MPFIERQEGNIDIGILNTIKDFEEQVHVHDTTISDEIKEGANLTPEERDQLDN